MSAAHPISLLNPSPPPIDLTTANRTFFNNLAATYGIPAWQKDLAQQVTAFIQQNLLFIHPDLSIAPPNPPALKLLDYACGTGTITHALGPFVSSIQGVDLSSRMVDRYNDLAVLSDIPAVNNAHAVEGNLFGDNSAQRELAGPQFHDLDLVAVGAALHHFEDFAVAIGRLVRRLKVGGVLLIIDMVEEEKGWGEANEGTLLPEGVEHTVHRFGFGREEMERLMEGGGLEGFEWREMEEKVKMKMCEERPIYRKVFLARGMRKGVVE